jgi:hypothetical protein
MHTAVRFLAALAAMQTISRGKGTTRSRTSLRTSAVGLRIGTASNIVDGHVLADVGLIEDEQASCHLVHRWHLLAQR